MQPELQPDGRLSPWWRRELVARIELSPASVKSVLQFLCTRQGSNPDCFPSLRTIGKGSGCKKTATRAALRDLEHLGLLTTIMNTGESSQYRIDDHELQRLAGGLVLSPAGFDPGAPHRKAVPTPPDSGGDPPGFRGVMQTDECREVNAEALDLDDWIVVARRAAYGVLGPAGLQLDEDLAVAGDLARVCECLAIAHYRATESPVGYFKKAVRDHYQPNRRERAMAARMLRACYISLNQSLEGNAHALRTCNRPRNQSLFERTAHARRPDTTVGQPLREPRNPAGSRRDRDHPEAPQEIQQAGDGDGPTGDESVRTGSQQAANESRRETEASDAPEGELTPKPFSPIADRVRKGSVGFLSGSEQPPTKGDAA